MRRGRTPGPKDHCCAAARPPPPLAGQGCRPNSHHSGSSAANDQTTRAQCRGAMENRRRGPRACSEARAPPQAVRSRPQHDACTQSHPQAQHPRGRSTLPTRDIDKCAAPACMHNAANRRLLTPDLDARPASSSAGQQERRCSPVRSRRAGTASERATQCTAPQHKACRQ